MGFGSLLGLGPTEPNPISSDASARRVWALWGRTQLGLDAKCLGRWVWALRAQTHVASGQRWDRLDASARWVWALRAQTQLGLDA